MTTPSLFVFFFKSISVETKRSEVKEHQVPHIRQDHGGAGVGNARIPGGTRAHAGAGLGGSQTRKGQSEDGTEAADLGACSMVGVDGGGGGMGEGLRGGGGWGEGLWTGWCSQDGARANERESRGYFFT